MHGEPADFWSKLTFDDEGVQPVAWHPLADHCADVGACCEALLERTILRRRLARIAGLDDLSASQVARLAALTTLHDLGKVNLGFQNKALPAGTPGRFTAGHVREVMDLIGAADYSVHHQFLAALPTDALLSWADGDEGALRLLLAAICHHGRPIPLGAGAETRIWQPARGLDPFDGLRALVGQTREWFPEAFEPGGEPLPITPPFQHAFSGLVMLADWLGSDSDRFFPFTEEPGGDRMPFARGRAREALRWIGLDSASTQVTLPGSPVGFERVSPYPPRPAQQAVLELPADQEGSLTILEAETGAGKTEAALLRYLRLFQAGEVDGIYFALPTRTAATQIHRRVVEVAERAFGPDEHPPVVLAVPGYIAVDDRVGSREDELGRRLPHFEVLWPDDPGERYRFRGWAAEHSKRYLAGAIVVGTVDQVLLSALAVPHAHMRATALQRLLLVVDEVHASDAYMTRILESVLAQHLEAGGHAFLMSATLGTHAAHRLTAIADGGRSGPPNLSEGLETPFPGLVHVPLGRPGQRLESLPSRPAKRVRVEVVPTIDRPEEVACRALDAATAGARVLVIRNTVRACVATQNALEQLAQDRGQIDLLFGEAGVAAPHHSRFAREDRELLDRAIERELGEHRPPGGCVAVATQTVQQSLDLDADLMITDLCPMDVLLQRIGRLHRHDRSGRPLGFEAARVIVLVPEERDLSPQIRGDGRAPGAYGIGTVYEDLRILEATWRLLETGRDLEIPTMNRELVERTTHPEALDAIVAELGEPWPEHRQWLLGRYFADRRHADLNLLDRSVSFGEAQFPGRELARKIETRLGEEDRLMHLEPPIESPFAQTISSLKVPERWAFGVPAETETRILDTTGGRTHLQWGAAELVYDRLGLRPVAESDEGADEIDE